MKQGVALLRQHVRQPKAYKSCFLSPLVHCLQPDSAFLQEVQAEQLAVEIEDELFQAKDVNYGKMGRALIFNLKDPNNASLRRRIFSKELSPAQLVCTPSASKSFL